MFRIKKIYNNNVALVNDANGLEQILIGKGIAFQKSQGSIIQQEKIEKVFTIDSSTVADKFIQLIKEVPINQLDLVTKIVKDAEKYLRQEFDELTYIGLTDHINYALNRFRKGFSVNNALLLETKKFYPDEYAAALRALELIKYYEGISLSDDEAGFIALHFVNGEQDKDFSFTLLTTEVMEKILLILEDQLKIKLDSESLNYLRFVTHLKFFLQRVYSDENRNTSVPEMFKYVLSSYPDATKCVDIISEYLREKFQCNIFPEEKMYLILHVQRLI